MQDISKTLFSTIMCAFALYFFFISILQRGRTRLFDSKVASRTSVTNKKQRVLSASFFKCVNYPRSSKGKKKTLPEEPKAKRDKYPNKGVRHKGVRGKG